MKQDCVHVVLTRDEADKVSQGMVTGWVGSEKHRAMCRKIRLALDQEIAEQTAAGLKEDQGQDNLKGA